MTDTAVTKVWYKSRTLWATALTMLFGIYALAQTNIPGLHLIDINGYLPIIFTVLGAIGIYGRVDANGKITFSDQASK